jgi:Flp pilus assembly secretin CpaC
VVRADAETGRTSGIGLVFVPVVLDSGLVSLTVDVSVPHLGNED